MSETWTIGELAERAADALGPQSPRGNGRVREVPGERLIRWYTTIGLVDPPLTRRGRIARYGRRHLLQLVSVKRLQAEGHSIAEIQSRLAGAADSHLETTARLESAARPEPTDLLQSTTRPEPATVRERFWTDGTTTTPAPAPTAPHIPPTDPPATAPADTASSATDAPAAPPVNAATVTAATDTGAPGAAPGTPVQVAYAQDVPAPGAGTGQGAGVSARVGGILLADGVVLVLRGAPTDDDIEAVLAAAGPLLQVLEERNLT
ncbi:helix-turn-helix domain-containing protein [Nonomuraea longicatena]|uniref:HTH merR-type domain-containing protein n=1 Tax=Nonomuraea longicatena TaxID=83682 RepID=A0ABN1PR03_9ACTN